MREEKAEFMDEKIIELIREKENEIEQELEKDRIARQIREGAAVIDGEHIEFVEKSLLNDRISIFLPKTFTIMSQEAASIKYPFELRPNPIFTDITTTKNICLNYTTTSVLEKDIGEFKDSMRVVLENLQPSSLWLEDTVKEINGIQIGCFDFISPAMDTSIYNLMFFTELDGKALICSFNCVEQQMESWKCAAMGMMSTFKINGRAA